MLIAEEAPAIREIPMAEQPKPNAEYTGSHIVSSSLLCP
jgi:hypothetical protein